MHVQSEHIIISHNNMMVTYLTLHDTKIKQNNLCHYRVVLYTLGIWKGHTCTFLYKILHYIVLVDKKII